MRPFVTPIGVADAEQTIYQSLTSLPSTATMSQARAATAKAAITLNRSQQSISAADAWEDVGVR